MNPAETAGPLGRARRRLRNIVRPNVQISPPPDGVILERDVEVVVRDGTTLRVNVFRPEDGGRYPVLMSAHPYGKDYLPKQTRKGYRPFPNLRVLPQSQPFTISAWTGWEAPDPGYWVPRGYVVINADLRGWGRSDGIGDLFAPDEGADYHDLIEWAAAQPWSTGKVGLTGVSYLAVSQWAAAATRPPHLAAICPWEGFTSLWDVARPGGVREDGLMIVWTRGTKRSRPENPVDLRTQQKARPLRDEWWAARDQALEKIEVPALVCASFSDHNLHSKGSFDGFLGIASARKWLYTHRGPKWSEYYGRDGLAAQTRFFDHFLNGEANDQPDLPPVRLEIRSDADTVTSVRYERHWPPQATVWTRWRLHPDGRLDESPSLGGRKSFRTRGRGLVYTHRFTADTEIVGPMRLRLSVEVEGGGDAHLFAGVRKLRRGRPVAFEGAYGFRGALVTHGIRKASHHVIGPGGTPRDDVAEPLLPGQIVPVEIELLPSATFFRSGEDLELVIQGRWFYARNPFTGQFPAYYEKSPRGRCAVHLGPSADSHLEIPVQPGTASAG
ncbi:MAG TPA: CocE/NonD family hydrolase [Jiangellaceae bacterium]